MITSQSIQKAIPSPHTTHTKRNRNERLQRHAGAAQRSERQPRAEVPAQSSHHFTLRHVLVLIIVLVGVTLGMVLSFLWLFDGEESMEPLSAWALSPSLSMMDVISMGAAASIMLWIARFFFRRPAGERSAQSASISPSPLVSAEQAVVLPEPYQAGKRLSSRFPSRLDSWMTHVGEMDSAGRKTDALEAQHLRRRLRTLPLMYRNVFPGDQDTEHGSSSVPGSVHPQASSAWWQHDAR